MQDAVPKPEAHAAEAEETIAISHGDDGTDLFVEDPTWLEVGAFALFLVAAVASVWVWRRTSK